MAITIPENMEELIYMTRRALDGGNGKAMAWVYKQDCPECGKAKMGKPVVKGKIKIRAKEYVCPECDYTAEKDEYEATLTCEIKYTCPHCQNEGEAAVPFKRKTFQGVPAVVFECSKCNEKIGISKKMKVKAKKK